MSDLDSFFAKKDKKTKKLKGRKYDNPDDIAKRLQESEKKLEKERFKAEPVPKTLDEIMSSSNSITEKPVENVKKDEEEWNEFTDESQKDMTDLKISNLQIENDEDYMGGYGSGEDGEAGSGGNNASEGVWNKNIAKTEEVAEEEEKIAPPTTLSKDENTKSSYKPPHLRNLSSLGPSHLSRNPRRPKTAPDITNAMAFPSLADAQTGPPGGPWGRKRISEDRGYENVKHGSLKPFSNDYSTPKLSTTNRFAALRDS